LKKEHRVTAMLRQMVEESAFKTGDRLPSERELAASFHTSRHTLRSAMRQLEAQGLIQVRTGSGCYVLSPEASGNCLPPPGFLIETHDLQHLFEARYLMEPVIGALAADKASAADINALEGCLTRIGRAIVTAQPDEMDAAHRGFLNRIAACTRNALLEMTARQLGATSRFLFRIFERFERAEREAVFADYVSIVTTIKSGNADLTCAQIQQHILRVCQLLIRYEAIELPDIIQRAIRENPAARD
jgi:GntR family transcriptional repressor for pyruvate dehydrogenase complex